MKINLPKYENSSVERFVNAVVKLWNSINKWVLFGSLASLTLIATLCFPAMFLKILLIFEVIGLSTALLVTTSSSDKVDEENIDDDEDDEDEEEEEEEEEKEKEEEETRCIEFNMLKDGFEFIVPDQENGIKFADLCVKEPIRELTPLLNFVNKVSQRTPTTAYHPENHILVIGENGSGKNALIRAFANEANLHLIKVHASRFFENDDLLESLFEIAPHIERYILQIDSLETLYVASASTGNTVFSEIVIDKLQKYLEIYPNVILFATCEDPIALIADTSYQKCFKKVVSIEAPDFKERRALLDDFTYGVDLSDDINFDSITNLCVGFSIGEIKEFVKTAIEYANQNEHDKVTQNDFFDAFDAFSCGSVHDKKHNAEMQKLVAYHEAGHAVMEYILSGKKSVIRVLSTSRGTTGGYTLTSPDEEKVIIPKHELLDRICILYGGRCAEKIVFDALSTGASSDIQSATALISSMVQKYGMSDEIGPLNISSEIALMSIINESSEMQNLIFRECIKIAKECEERTMRLLTDNRSMLDALANYLIDNESISGEDMDELLKSVENPDK